MKNLNPKQKFTLWYYFTMLVLLANVVMAALNCSIHSFLGWLSALWLAYSIKRISKKLDELIKELQS